MWTLGRSVGTRHPEDSIHIPKEQEWNDAKTPGGEELEKEVEKSEITSW